MVEIGHFSLVLAFALALVQAGVPLIGARLDNERMMAVGGPVAITGFAMIALSFAALTIAYVQSDFSVANVWENSHSLKPMLFKMLGGNPGEVTLTENNAMLPTSAVSGFYFAHRDSQYFGVARIGRDQLEDYAARRAIDLPTAERWLRPNLE